MEDSSPQEHRLELTEVLFAAAFIVIAAFSLVGLLLAELTAFSGWRVAAGGTALSLVCLGAGSREFRRLNGTLAPVSSGRWIVLGLVVVAAAFVFCRPGQYLIEGADASVYLATGQTIHRSGAIRVDDPVAEVMPADVRSAFFPRATRGRPQEGRFSGGVRFGADGKIAPDFFHLLPVWIAIALSAAGPLSGYFVNVAFAIMSVVAVCLVGRRAWTPAAGVVAAVLLMLNFGQVYNARILSSEIIAQFMLLAAILFAVMALDLRSRVAGACAGVAVGLGALTRIDILLLMVPLTGVWLAVTWRRQSMGPAWAWFAAGLALVSGHAALHALTVASAYTIRLLENAWVLLGNMAARVEALPVVAGVIAVGLLVIAKSRGYRVGWIWILALLGVVLRPPPLLVAVSQLLSPMGTLTAVAGLTLFYFRRTGLRELPVIVPCLVDVALLVGWRETTTLPEDFRRAVPTILPGTALLMAYLVTQVAQVRPLARAIWLLPVGLAGFLLTALMPILRTPPMQAVHAQIADLAHQIPASAVVVVDRRVPGHMALALQHSFNRTSFRLETRPPGNAGLSSFFTRFINAGYPVFVAVAPMVEAQAAMLRHTDLEGFDIQPVSLVTLHYDVVAPVQRQFPRELRSDTVPIALYEVRKLDPEGKTLPLVFDIGRSDLPAVLDGFHMPELIQSADARWTASLARMALPRLAPTLRRDVTLVLRLSADRPPGVPGPAIQLAIDDIPAGRIESASPGFREYRVALPPAALSQLLAGPSVLSIRTGAFTPKDVGLNDDARQLGIVLDWVRIE